MSKRMDKRQVLEKRAAHLKRRIFERGGRGENVSFDKQELSAIDWFLQVEEDYNRILTCPACGRADIRQIPALCQDCRKEAL